MYVQYSDFSGFMANNVNLVYQTPLNKGTS